MMKFLKYLTRPVATCMVHRCDDIRLSVFIAAMEKNKSVPVNNCSPTDKIKQVGKYRKIAWPNVVYDFKIKSVQLLQLNKSFLHSLARKSQAQAMKDFNSLRFTGMGVKDYEDRVNSVQQAEKLSADCYVEIDDIKNFAVTGYLPLTWFDANLQRINGYFGRVIKADQIKVSEFITMLEMFYVAKGANKMEW